MDQQVKQIGLTIFRLALTAGAVYLAANDRDGWGWLIFVLLCTL